MAANDFLKQLGLVQEEDEAPIMLQNPVVQEVQPALQPTPAPVEKSPEQLTAAGVLSQYAEPRNANYQAPRIEIPEVDPKIAQAQMEQQKALIDKLSGLDSNYKQELQDAEDRKFKSQIFATLGNYLPTAVAGATAMNTKASVSAPNLPKIEASDPTGGVERKYKTDYENLLKQYKQLSGKDGGLTDKDKLYASIAQAQLDNSAARLNNNIETVDKNAGISVGKAKLADQKGNEVTDKQLESISDYDRALQTGAKIGQEAAKFKDKLGPLASKIEEYQRGALGAVIPGKSDPKFTEFQAQVEGNRAEYQKAISGLTVSDREREALNKSIPTVEDRYEDFMAKQKAFTEKLQAAKKKSEENIKKYQGKNTEGYNSEAPQKSAPSISPADQKALDWANSNPNDPRAAAILKKLGR